MFTSHISHVLITDKVFLQDVWQVTVPLLTIWISMYMPCTMSAGTYRYQQSQHTPHSKFHSVSQHTPCT